MFSNWFQIVLFFLILTACQSGENQLDLIEKDLLSYGIPITLQMPDSAQIKTMDWGTQKDITIKSPTAWYSLQLFSSMATKHNMDAVKAEYLELAQENPYFQRVVSEDPDGFIYELVIDSLTNYDFRHIKIQGDKEYVFQAGMYGTYTLDQIEQLYQISKSAK